MTTEYKAEDVSVEDWIDGVSFLQADVTIYRNPAILAEYNPLLARAAVLEEELDELTSVSDEEDGEDAEATLSSPQEGAEAPVPTGERSLSEKPVSDPRVDEIKVELDKLYARAEELHAQFTADTEVWTLRKVEPHEAEKLREELGGLPPEPAKLPTSGASKAVQARHVAAMEEWFLAMKAFSREFAIHALSFSVLKVVVKGKEVPLPTLEQLRRIATRPGGSGHIDELARAMDGLTAEGVSIVAPHRGRA